MFMDAESKTILRFRTPVRWVKGGSFPRLKRSGLEANHWNPCDGIENVWSYSSAPPCAFVACRGTVLPSLTFAGSDSNTFAATHKELCVLVQKTQVPECLRWVELSCVVTNAICMCTNSVGEEVGLYRTVQIIQKFKRRLKILRACAAVKKLIARAIRHPEFLHPFHRLHISTSRFHIPETSRYRELLQIIYFLKFLLIQSGLSFSMYFMDNPIICVTL